MSHCALQCLGQADGSVQADQTAVAGVVSQLGGRLDNEVCLMTSLLEVTSFRRQMIANDGNS